MGRGHKPGEIGRVWSSCSNPSSVTYRTLLEEADKADPEWRSRYYAPQREQRCRDREQWIEHQYQDFRREQEAEAEWDCEGEEIKMGEECVPDGEDDEEPGKKEPPRNRRTWCYFDEY